MPPSRSDARWSTGKWIAAVLAVAIHLAFVVFLVFSVTWQNRKPEAVSVELYAPPSPEKVEPAKSKPPEPEPPKPEPPKPEPPKPEPPKPQPEPPKPQPEPPKLPPKVEPPQPTKAEIALKEKKEIERKKQAQLERDQLEREKREAEKREADKRDAEKRKAEEKRLVEVRERQTREADALKAQAARERLVVAQAAESALAKANEDYVRQIQAKIRALVVVPPDIAGNPEAIFEVVQLPTGEIIDTQLRKSSGVRAYDDAVQRAIIRASPLPLPKSAELFRRNLTLKFRPRD
jgi:colicin import membrane protein